MPETVKSNIIEINVTALDDVKFRLVQSELWIREGNFIIVSNPAYYGDRINPSNVVTVGTVISFQDFNLSDIFFRNFTPGSNTTINFVGVVMTKKRMEDFGV